jgi:hypothetical protein
MTAGAAAHWQRKLNKTLWVKNRVKKRGPNGVRVAARAKMVEQAAALHELRHNIVRALVRAHAKQLHQIRMLQLSQKCICFNKK